MSRNPMAPGPWSNAVDAAADRLRAAEAAVKVHSSAATRAELAAARAALHTLTSVRPAPARGFRRTV